MGNLMDNHPVVFIVIVCVLILALVVGGYYGYGYLKNGVFNGNRQVVDTIWGYEYGIVRLANGEIIEGKVKSWRDFDESDMLQITFVDKGTYLVHSVNASLNAK